MQYTLLGLVSSILMTQKCFESSPRCFRSDPLPPSVVSIYPAVSSDLAVTAVERTCYCTVDKQTTSVFILVAQRMRLREHIHLRVYTFIADDTSLESDLYD